MATSRLTTAIEGGELILPEGPVRVLRPDPGMDLSALPQIEVDHGAFPARQAWLDRGVPAAGEDKVPTVLVCAPRSKALARQMVLQALEQASELVIIDGQKTDGIDSLWKACRDWAPIAGTITKAHGRLFWFPVCPPPDWHIPLGHVDGFVTRPGVFSEDKIDKGSALLARTLPPLKGTVADFGAGWGYLSRQVLTSADVTALHMVEAERVAIACLNDNITDARATAHWADATTWTAPAPLGTIVMNPPFHEGRKGVPALGAAFIQNAARNLAHKGTLWLVANRHLPYEETLARLFREVSEVAGESGFKVIKAAGVKAGPKR